MKKLFIITTFMFIIGAAFQASFAQDNAAGKVANYSFGKMGQSGYEHFSFRTEDGKHAEITYSYGKDAQESKLEYLDAKTIQGRKGFEVKFPNNLILFVIPTGNNLRVINPVGSYNKIFKWQSEGPVNGIGTACEACAENETEAMVMIKNGYFN